MRSRILARQTGCVPPNDLPTVTVKLWRDDAVVLYDWLKRTDLNTVPIDHPAEKQALTDLLSRLDGYTDVPYGGSGSGLTQAEIDAARAAVAARSRPSGRGRPSRPCRRCDRPCSAW